jgi:hypothetical protein
MSNYQVKNIDIDVYDYKKHFCFDKIDIEVCSQYIDSNTYNVIVRRIDSNQGWNDDTQVLVYYREREHTQIVQIGSSQEHEKVLTITSDFTIEESDVLVYKTPIYNLGPFPQSIWISREQFNDMFSTNVVLLPTSMYAIGLSRDGYVYIYNEIHTGTLERYIDNDMLIQVKTELKDFSKIASGLRSNINEPRFIKSIKAIKDERCIIWCIRNSEQKAFSEKLGDKVAVLTTKVVKASPSISSAIIKRGLPV